MPINAFGGGPGSGKTYGVMEHVILPAVAAGRFVLTNIDGLKPDLIYQYVVDHAPKDKIICVGHIRMCGRDAPEKADFFPGIDKLDDPEAVPSPDRKTVNGGDLVVVDEATRYWPVGERVSKADQFFFREHRHFANEVGDTCDLVVIDPDLTQLARPLRGKLEMSSVTRKLKEVGIERYMVDLFRGGKVTGKPYQNRGPYKFQKEIYSLYKSYSHEKAKEQIVDKRQNMFGGTYFKIVIPLALLALCFGVWMGYRFLTGKTVKQSSATVSSSAAAPGAAAPAPAVPKSNEPQISDKWRGQGYVVSSVGVTFYMEGEGGKTRLLASPKSFAIQHRQFEFKDGESWVTSYSGVSSPSSRSGSMLR